MKGYIFSVGGPSRPPDILKAGLFGVWQNTKERKDETKYWGPNQLATFADYLTISPGDLIFFFKERKIYGVAEAVGIDNDAGSFCAYLNYPESYKPDPPQPSDGIITEGEWSSVRVALPFVPSPVIYSEGIDMDEALTGIESSFFWGLRYWEGFSFQELSWEEAMFLKKRMLIRFGHNHEMSPNREQDTLIEYVEKQKPFGQLSLWDLLKSDEPEYINESGELKSEALLHGLLIEHLKKSHLKPLSEAKSFDIYHELACSPPKPTTYVDKLDIMVARHFDESLRQPYRYDVLEVKKAAIPETKSRSIDGKQKSIKLTFEEQTSQLMKYVDFISSNWCAGNYGAVKSYLIGKLYEDDFKTKFKEARDQAKTFTRTYVLNPREGKEAHKRWDSLELLQYDVDCEHEEINLTNAHVD